MKVLNLRCHNGHVFEGWFGSDDDFMQQNGSAMIECPLCADRVISRLPAAPRLNLSGARAPAIATSTSTSTSADRPAADSAPPVRPDGDLQAAWVAGVRALMARTENVGRRFAEEARRIHYGESPQRGIRGQTSPEERAALHDEGIETISIPVPRALEEPLQ